MIDITGIGTMGGTIAHGLIATGAAPSELVVYSANVGANVRFVCETGARLAYSNVDLIERAGDDAIVVVAIKLFAVGGVLDEIWKAVAKRGSVIVSVAAGTPIKFLGSRLGPGRPVVRTISNMAAAVDASAIAYACNPAVAPHTDDVADVLASIGIVGPMTKNDFSAFSAIARCSSAFTFGYVDAMARAAVKSGLPKTSTIHIAAQAVYGTARLLPAKLDNRANAASLADAVQSPGGTIVAGVVELEQAGFETAMVQDVQVPINRDKELLG